MSKVVFELVSVVAELVEGVIFGLPAARAQSARCLTLWHMTGMELTK